MAPRTDTTFTSVRRWVSFGTLVLFAGAATASFTSCVADPVCGDDVVNLDDEECDGDDFDGTGCANYGFDEGELGCNSSCKVKTDACVILDADFDGLNIYDEQALGTDPLNPDSDDDGVLDGDEVNNGSNPLDMYSWPIGTGMWPNRLQALIDDGVTATGWNQGDVMHNLGMIDQYGKNIQLYQFYGYPIVLSVGAVWCPPCNQAAATSQQLWEEKMGTGVIFVEQLVDGVTPGIDATPQEVQNWVNKYDIQFPVCQVDGVAAPAQAVPTFFLMNSDMTISRKVEGFPGDPTLSSYIDALY